jgi:hypothetical protein
LEISEEGKKKKKKIGKMIGNPLEIENFLEEIKAKARSKSILIS